MNKKYVSFKEFKQKCINFSKMNSFHDINYVNSHIVRFYNTYKFIINECGDISGRIKLLSIGAGGAFVEAFLQEYGEFDCTVLDFPEEININEDYYKKLGFKTISTDIADVGINREIDSQFETYDIIISLENIEHIPDAPSNYMRKFIPYLKNDGFFCVSTPNLASIRKIENLVLMKPILADPEKFFGSICFKNEGTHRREYMVCEMESEMEKVGLGHFKIKYTNLSSMSFNIKRLLIQPIYLISRFRENFIIIGKLI